MKKYYKLDNSNKYYKLVTHEQPADLEFYENNDDFNGWVKREIKVIRVDKDTYEYKITSENVNDSIVLCVPRDNFDRLTLKFSTMEASTGKPVIFGRQGELNLIQLGATDLPMGLREINVSQSLPTKQTSTSKPRKDISMMVLGGFMFALGVSAVALAFTFLNIATLGAAAGFGAVVGAGAGLIFLGLKFFGTGYREHLKTMNPVADDSNRSVLV